MRAIATDRAARLVSVSFCVRMSITTMSAAKTDEPIEMPFGRAHGPKELF